MPWDGCAGKSFPEVASDQYAACSLAGVADEQMRGQVLVMAVAEHEHEESAAGEADDAEGIENEYSMQREVLLAQWLGR